MARRARHHKRRFARVELLFAVLLVVQVIAVADAPVSAASASIEFGANPGGANDGRIAELNDLEAQINRPLDFVRVFEVWDSPYPTAYHNTLISTNHKMLFSVRAKKLDGSFIAWRDIADAQPGSQIHDEMVAWIERVRDVGAPVWFSFNHEPETVENIANGTDQDFIDAWRRFIDEFRARNVTNVEFVWIMTDYSFAVPAADRRHAPKWYPGDDVVDYIAADAYNWSDCRPTEPNPWRTMTDIIDPLRLFGLDHPDKGLMLAEWASTETPGDNGAAKAAWIADVSSLLQQPGWEQFVAVAYFNQPDPRYPACAWNVDSTAASLDAFRAMANDPFYGGSANTTGGVVFVVGNAATLDTGESAVLSRLQALGVDVTVVDDDVATAGSAIGADLVLISSSVNATLGSTFKSVATPVWVSKPWILDDMGMAGPAGGVDYGSTSASQISITDPTHPLAAGFSGTISVTSASRLTQFGLPTGEVDTVATVSGKPTIYTYDAGTLMSDGTTASGCRIAFSIYQAAPVSFTTDGWALFDAAVDYAIGGCATTAPNDQPVVSITSPTPGQTVNGVVAVVADASDDDGVAQVEFFVGGVSVGVDGDGSDGWSVVWDSAGSADGLVVVSATATDSGGNLASDSVSVSVDNLGPSVSVTSPVDGATVSGVVSVVADASDVVGVAQVEFFADGGSVGVDTNGGDGWSVSWDTAGLDGAVSLSATATDVSGHTDTDAISVTVDASGAGVVVLVVGNPAALSSGDVAVVARFESLGLVVTLVDDNAATAGSATGADLVVVSSTANSNVLKTVFKSVATPVWVSKPFLLDDMGMTGVTAGTDYGSVNASQWTITDPAHPLAGGLSGTVSVTTSSRLTQFGVPGGDGSTVATAAGLPSIFVYEAGEQLADGTTAAGCRLAFSIFQTAPASFTTNGWVLFDAAATYATNGCVPVSPNDPPVVSVTSPVAGPSLTGVVSVTADATDSDGVAQVEFLVDGTSIGVDTDGTDGWSTSWDTTTTGDGAAVIVTAKATDTLGGVGTGTVTVTVDNDGPTVTITAPTNGATTIGTVTVTATATDAVGVTQVEFLIDGTSIGVDTNGTDGWTAPWDTTTTGDGPATISATATDTGGHTDTDTISVTVDNTTNGLVVMVVGNPASLPAGATAVKTRLEGAGYLVTVLDDDGITAADTTGSSLVIIGASTNSNKIKTALNGLTQTVWDAKPWHFDDLGLTGTAANTDYGTTSITDIAITNPTHPLAAGLSGTIGFTTSANTASWGQPTTEADIIATANGQPTILVYQPGTTLANGTTAPGCRITFPLFGSGPTKFTTNAWTLFDTTTTYATNNCTTGG